MTNGNPERPWFLSDEYRSTSRYSDLDGHLQSVADRLYRDGAVVLPGLIPAESAEGARRALERYFEREPHRRLTNAWRYCDQVRALASNPDILSLLNTLYGRVAFPFQTLNFAKGTEQRAHADTIHFDTIPSGFMCGVWVALEDIGAHQGPLRYYRGSHREGGTDPRRLVGDPDEFRIGDYEDAVASLMSRYEPVDIQMARGDALLWTASLVHGGAPILDAQATRWSQVTHYYFSGCAYLTPMRSEASTGRYHLRRPLLDIATGLVVEHQALGAAARLLHVAKGRTRILGPDEEPPWRHRVESRVRSSYRDTRWRLSRLRTASRG